MAMKIRLARAGSKKRPFYRIVAADSRMPRDGRFLEKLGTYNPLLPKDSEDRVKMDVERIQHWLAQGAQPTDRITRMLEAAGVREKARANMKKAVPGKKAQERAAEGRESRRARGRVTRQGIGMSEFSTDFQADLLRLMRRRRDVRRFRTEPVDEAILRDCLATFTLAPSVGLSEPWRVIRVQSAPARAAALANFSDHNSRALDGYEGEKARLYSGLKLSGMREAPVQLAVFCAEDTPKGAGLGAQTMPEMRRYSVVSAITQFWLAARAQGLGLGWVSILDPVRLSQDLDISNDWRLVAYLCIGWPEAESDTPELERAGWEQRRPDVPVETR